MMDYTIREAIYVDALKVVDIYAMDLSLIPRLVLRYEDGDNKYTADVGSWCFEVKKERNSHQKVMLVNLDAINLSRIRAIKDIVIDFIEKSNSTISLRNKLKTMQVIIKYMDNNHKGADIENFEVASEIYKKYSMELLDLKRKYIADGSKSNFDSLSIKQKAMREFLSISTHESQEVFASLVLRLKLDKINRLIREIDGNQIKKFESIQIKIFEDLSTAIMIEKKLPYAVDLRKFGSARFIFDFNFIKKSAIIDDTVLYDENLNIIPQEKFDDWLSKSGKITAGHTRSFFNNLYKIKIKNLEESNAELFPDCRIKVKLANIAIIAFCKAFIGATSVNESVLYDLKANGFIYVASSKGMRGYGVKNRAKNKSVPIEFGLKFSEYFNKYLKFREFLLSIFPSEVAGGMSDNLFFILPNNFGPNKECFTKISSKTFTNYNRDYFKVFWNGKH